MSVVIGDIEGLITLKDDATPTLQKVERQAKQTEEALGDAGDKVAELAKEVRNYVLAYVSIHKVLEVTKEAFHQAAAGQRAEILLAQAIRNRGEAYRASTEELVRNATELSKVSEYGSTTIKNVETILTRFNSINGSNIKSVTELVLDFASATGEDATGAALRLGRALEMPTMGLALLRRQGILLEPAQVRAIKNMEEHGQKAKASAMLFDILTKKYKDFAQITANSASGALTRFKNAWEDALETMGNSGILESATKALQALIAKMQDPAFQEFAKTLGGNLAQLVRGLGDALQFVVDHANLLLNIAKTFLAYKFGSYIVGFGDKLIGLAGRFETTGKKWGNFLDGLSRGLPLLALVAAACELAAQKLRDFSQQQQREMDAMAEEGKKAGEAFAAMHRILVAAKTGVKFEALTGEEVKALKSRLTEVAEAYKQAVLDYSAMLTAQARVKEMLGGAPRNAGEAAAAADYLGIPSVYLDPEQTAKAHNAMRMLADDLVAIQKALVLGGGAEDKPQGDDFSEQIEALSKSLREQRQALEENIAAVRQTGGDFEEASLRAQAFSQVLSAGLVPGTKDFTEWYGKALALLKQGQELQRAGAGKSLLETLFPERGIEQKFKEQKEQLEAYLKITKDGSLEAAHALSMLAAARQKDLQAAREEAAASVGPQMDWRTAERSAQKSSINERLSALRQQTYWSLQMAKATRTSAQAVEDLQMKEDIVAILLEQKLIPGTKDWQDAWDALTLAMKKAREAQDAVSNKAQEAALTRAGLILGSSRATDAEKIAAANQRMRIELEQVSQKYKDVRDQANEILRIHLEWADTLDQIKNDRMAKINAAWDSWIQAAQVVVSAIGEANGALGQLLNTAIGIIGAFRQIAAAQKAYAQAKAAQDKSQMAAAAGSYFAGWAAVIVAAYQIFDKHMKAVFAKRWGATADLSFDRGMFDWTKSDLNRSSAGNAASAFSKSMADLLKSIQAATGTFIEGMQAISVRIRNDGKRFSVTVGDVFVGVFGTAEEAMVAAARKAFSSAELAGTLTTAMREMLNNFAATTADELNSAISFINQIEDAASGGDAIDRALRTLVVTFKQTLQQLKEFGVDAVEATRLSGFATLNNARDLWNQISGKQMTPKELKEQAVQRAKMLELQLKLWRIELKARLDYLQGNAKIDRGWFGGGGGAAGRHGGLLGTELAAKIGYMQAEAKVTATFINTRAKEVAAMGEVYQTEAEILAELIKEIDALIADIDANIGKIKVGGAGGFGGHVNNFGSAVQEFKDAQKELRQSIHDLKFNEATTALTDRERLVQAFIDFQNNIKAAKAGNLGALQALPEMLNRLLELAKAFSGGGNLDMFGMTFAEFFAQIMAQAEEVANMKVPGKVTRGNAVYDERLHKSVEEGNKISEKHREQDQQQFKQAIKGISETAGATEDVADAVGRLARAVERQWSAA